MNALKISRLLLDSLVKEDFSGFDPFDGLNSRLLQYSRMDKFSLVRLAWIQLFKRSPINFRNITFVPKKRNPKGIGLIILGLISDYKRTHESHYLVLANSLGEWLLTQKSNPEVWKHACWGYHFDWQARAFYVPKGKPNIITTCYVARALYDLSNINNNKEFRDTALDAARFIQLHLYTEHNGEKYFAYIPGEVAFVHNASLWGAAWLVYAGSILNDMDMINTAMDVCMQSVNAQNEDGSWVYGTRTHHQFIDGFHTGYNLEALNLVREVTNTELFDHAIETGMKYYKENLFLADGTPKYYHNEKYPLDMHSVAQAIITLMKVDFSEENRGLAEKIITWSIDNLYSEVNERFIYQKYKWFTNKINYLRWTQAWAYYSFAYYNDFSART